MFASQLHSASHGYENISSRAHLHPHRGAADVRTYVKRQYIFLIIACIVAAHTIYYSTSVLLTSLPDRGRREPSLTTSAPPALAHAPVTSSLLDTGACNVSSSPYALQLQGDGAFPALAHFIRTNVLLFEDLHPASFWIIHRETSSQPGEQKKERDYVEWGLGDGSPLLPLPQGVLPLFAHAPRDVACSRAQVLHQWREAHALAPPQLLEQQQQLMLRDQLAVDAPAAMAGLGHPQGLLLRITLPVELEPEVEVEAGGGEGAAAAATGHLPGGGRLKYKERLLFQAEDRFSGGERLFPMRSMTKALVALLCMALQDRGLLSVDDPVHQHLPDWREGMYGNMTVGMLLSHTAGYDNASTEEVLVPGDISLLEAAQRTMSRINVTSQPGTRFWYTEIGYQVLGAVVEAATGLAFHDALEEMVLVPAGLCSTRIINWWADVVPTHGPLIPDCVAPPEPPPGSGRTGSAGGSGPGAQVPAGAGRGGQQPQSRRQLQRAAVRATGDLGTSAEAQEGSDGDGRGGGSGGGGGGTGGRFGDGVVDGPGRWSSNPTVAMGGITSANDLGRLMALLANGGRATCCRTDPGAAEPAAKPGPSGAHWFSSRARSKSSAWRGGRSSGRGKGGSGGPVSPSNSGAQRDLGSAYEQTQQHQEERQHSGDPGEGGGGGGSGARRRRCECGGRVVSQSGVAAMLSRKPTPGLKETPLIRSFTHATPLTAYLLVGMGLLDATAYEAWVREVWSEFGYGYGVWVSRNGVTHEDHVWLYGAFNTLAGLLRMSPNSTVGVLSRAERPEGRHSVALVGVSMGAFNGMWAVLAGYVAA